MKVKELLKDPKNWTQGALVRDANNNLAYNENAYKAVSWCMMGAVNKCYDNIVFRIDLKDRIVKHLGFKMISEFVDWHDAPERKHEEVLKIAEELDF